MGRSPCCEKQHTNKGAWTKEEDQRLIDYIRIHGEGCWRSLPKAAGLLRCGKSCRLRWINYLRPDLKRGNFTDDEDQLIVKLHSLLGNKWSVIAGRLPGRTDNEIKNYWNTHIKRKLISRGIDPQTHRPIKDATPSLTDLNGSITPSVKLKTEFPDQEEANCATSGTTTDEELQQNHYIQDKDDEKPILELSLGRSRPMKTDRFMDSVLAEPGGWVVPLSNGWGVKTETILCLCCRLGLQRTEPCGNC